MSTVTGLMDSVRRPEYTGQNRCIPCTAVNLVIAIGLSAILGYSSLGWVAGPPGAIAVGGVSFGVFAGAIYLRGYLVPYTPALTKQYFPDRILRWFDKQPTASTEDGIPEIDIERTLLDLQAIGECETRDDLCVDPEFQSDWRDQIVAYREADTETRQADIAQLFDMEDSDHEIREMGNAAAVVLIDNQQVGQWESNAALIADLAADTVFRERHDRWLDYHLANRSQLLASLRMFLEFCPACDAPVSIGQETVESCCRSMDVIAVSCQSCDSRVFEMELNEQLQQHMG